MPKRDWHLILAIGGCLILALSGVVSSNNPKQNWYQSYRYPGDDEAGAIAALTVDPQAFEYREPCNNPKGHDESDLCAQWRAAYAAEASARWAKWGFWIGLLGVIGLLVTIIQGRKALSRARKSNAISREIGQAEARAYVHVFKVELKDVVGKFRPRITVSYKNFGQTPARKLACNSVVSLVFSGGPPSQEIKKNSLGFDLGPGQDAGTTSSLQCDDAMLKMLGIGAVELFVAGEIRYRDVFCAPDESRFTKFRFRLHVDPEGLRDTDTFIICEEGNDSD